MLPLKQKSHVYDIVNAGPKHRFCIKTEKGPMLVSNCVLGLGYGTGWKKLQSALKNNKTVLSDEECQRIVRLYRSHYSKIRQLWTDCGNSLAHMFEGYTDAIGTIRMPVDPVEKTIGLPNGQKLRYPDLQRHEGEMGWEYDYQTRRERKRVYGPYLSENLTQALARIVVGYQMLAIRRALERRSKLMNDGKIRQIVHFVHDEVVVVVPEDEQEVTMKMMELIMSEPPKWAPEMPVSCEAGGGKTYGDAK